MASRTVVAAPRLLGLACACGVAFCALPTWALDLTGGVSVGGILAGTKPHLAVSPHLGIAWRTESGFVLAARDMFSILAAVDKGGVGVYNRTSATLGYATERATFSVGPSLSFYAMPACNAASRCWRVVGLAVGGHGQADVFFTGPLGISLDASIEWLGGRSRALPGGVAAMVVAGPVIRWTTR